MTLDLSRKEAFQASDDLAFGPAIGGASGDVVAGWLVESHADDDGFDRSPTAPRRASPGRRDARWLSRAGAALLHLGKQNDVDTQLRSSGPRKGRPQFSTCDQRNHR